MNNILANVSPKVRKAFYAALQVFAYPGKHNTIPSKLQRRDGRSLSGTRKENLRSDGCRVVATW